MIANRLAAAPRVIVIAVALLMSACGGAAPESPTSPSPPPTPTATTTPSQPSPITITGNVGTYATMSHEVDGPVGRNLTVTLTWTSDVDLDLYLTDAGCTGYPPDRCHILALSTTSTGQREELTWSVTQAARLQLWVDNFSRSTGSAYTIVVASR